VRYFEWPTVYKMTKDIADITGQHCPPANEFYTKMYLTLMFNKNPYMKEIGQEQITHEKDWRLEGYPYYCVRPELTKVFSRSRLDFPANYVQYPFRATCIRFAEGDPTLRLDDKHSLQSMLCVQGIPTHGPYNKGFLVWMDFNERIPKTLLGKRGPARYDEFIVAYRQMAWNGDDTVEEALTKLPYHESVNYGLKVPPELISVGMKIAVSIAFLAKDESELIVPHLLKEDQPNYATATDTEKVSMVNKAVRRRNARGFLVGPPEYFDQGHIGAAPGLGKEIHAGSGRELQYAHMVTGHWKLVRYGPRMEQGRVRWIMPYVQGRGKPFRAQTPPG
jgi:hypothetical protein